MLLYLSIYVYAMISPVSPSDKQLKDKKTFDANDVCDSHSATCGPSHYSLSLAVVPYRENIIADFNHKERIFAFPGNHHVTIKQNWEEGGVASVVWDAAVVLSKYIVDNSISFCSQKIIELGAGTGLVGIVASLIGADVIITDRPVALDNLKDNVELNSGNVTGSAVVDELIWGRNLELFKEPFDFVIGADIIYIEDTFDDLLSTIRHLSDRHTTVILSCRIRYQRDRRFLDMLRQFFKVQEVLYDSKRDVIVYSAVRND